MPRLAATALLVTETTLPPPIRSRGRSDRITLESCELARRPPIPNTTSDAPTTTKVALAVITPKDLRGEDRQRDHGARHTIEARMWRTRSHSCSVPSSPINSSWFQPVDLAGSISPVPMSPNPFWFLMTARESGTVSLSRLLIPPRRCSPCR
jgi:hypothetical protein